MLETNKTGWFLGLFVIVVMAIAFLGLFPGEVQAAAVDYSFTHSDIAINDYTDSVYWNIWEELPANTAITSGKLSFDVVGIDDDNGTSEFGKLTLAGMFDSGSGGDINDRSYWIQARKNPSEFRDVLGQITLKGRINCTWFEGIGSRSFDYPWDPTVTYHGELTWHDTEASFRITGEDGLDLDVDASMPKQFAPLQQTVFFGRSPATIAYEAEPAIYSNIEFTAYESSSPVEFGESRCEIEDNSDSDDPDNPYDTCACHGIPDVDDITCEDEISSEEVNQISFLPSSDPATFATTGVSLDWLWNLGDVIKEGGQDRKKLAPLPDMSIELAPPAPKTGELMATLAATMNYRTRMQNIYFSWCLVDNNVTYGMNGIVAGGEELPEPTDPDLTWIENGCCQPITRTPAPGDDTDNDGMSDEWETRMFIGRHDSNYTDISQVNPNDDPDLDGYYADRFSNDKGQIMTVTPDLIDSLGNTYVTGASDARLTNIEEYILDTDPLNGDTDSDGYLDEMDYIGIGQLQLQFPIDKESGPDGYYDVSVSAVGISQAKKVALVAEKQRIFVGDDGNIEIELTANRDIMLFDDSQSLVLNAAVVGGEEEVGNIMFEWFFNGEPACDGVDPDFEDLCDPDSLGKAGKNTVVLGEGGISFFDLPEPTSESYDISVIATAMGSRGQSEASLSLPYAASSILTTVECAGQTEEITELTQNATDPVYICLSEDAGLGTADVNDLNFIWTVDGYTDNQQSGLSKTQYSMVPNLSAGETQTVGLTVKDTATSSDLTNGSLTFLVVGPTVEIVDPPSVSSDPIATGESRFISVDAGETVTLTAELSHFNSLLGYDVTWAVGSQSETFQTDSTTTTYAFDVPADASQGTTFGVSVAASSLDLEQQEQASDSLTLIVGDLAGDLGESQSAFQYLAAAFTKIPQAFQQLIVYAAIIAAVFFALVFVYPRVVRNWLDKEPVGFRRWQGKFRSSGNKLRREKKLALQLRNKQRRDNSED